MLNIQKEINGSDAVVKLEGRLDTTTAPQLENDLKSFMESVTSLVFDFENLEYISSAGLRVLLTAQKFMSKQGSMKLIHVKDDVNEIFDVTGFSDILTIE
jgi:anti-sigma B factor antagonist